MPSIAPQRASPPYRFEIARDERGHWIARDRDGLSGGTFVTCRAAMRFALYEVRGDAAQVYVASEPAETA